MIRTARRALARVKWSRQRRHHAQRVQELSPPGGDLVLVAVGLVEVALAFSALISAFTGDVGYASHRRPRREFLIVCRSRLDHSRSVRESRCVHLGHRVLRHLHVGGLPRAGCPLSRLHGQAGDDRLRRTDTPPPTKTCPESLSERPSAAATKCLRCASVVAWPATLPPSTGLGSVSSPPTDAVRPTREGAWNSTLDDRGHARRRRHGRVAAG